MDKIKLVVFNEHTIGYIMPERPDYVQVLHASILRGATFELLPTSKYISKTDKVRLASEKDFNDYRISFEGYKDNISYEYAK